MTHELLHSKIFGWHRLSHPWTQNPSPLHLERPSQVLWKQTNPGIRWAGLKIKVTKGQWGTWKEGQENGMETQWGCWEMRSFVASGLSGRWRGNPRAHQQVYDGNCSQSCLICKCTWLFVPQFWDHDIKQWWHGVYITPCRHHTCLLHAEPSSSQSVLFITTSHFFGYHSFSLSYSIALNT